MQTGMSITTIPIQREQFNRNVHVAEMLNFLSAFVLVIVVFGFAGLLLILLNKRRKEFSIALICGAIKHTDFQGSVFGNTVCRNARRAAGECRVPAAAAHAGQRDGARVPHRNAAAVYRGRTGRQRVRLRCGAA